MPCFLHNVDAAKVEALMKSITEIGLQEPVSHLQLHTTRKPWLPCSQQRSLALTSLARSQQ